MKDSARTLIPGLETDQRAWFEDFDQWQRAMFWEELQAAAKNLSENPSSEVAKLGGRVHAIVEEAKGPHAGAFVSLMAAAGDNNSEGICATKPSPMVSRA